jgi:hypothetical protein
VNGWQGDGDRIGCAWVALLALALWLVVLVLGLAWWGGQWHR